MLPRHCYSLAFGIRVAFNQPPSVEPGLETLAADREGIGAWTKDDIVDI